ncbi:hypothetical protein HYX13_05145 [Candidatus Woesearchaeota archaeon]|nr:hypothetical protein [Candidatus Woesearchaeota archaeon]
MLKFLRKSTRALLLSSLLATGISAKAENAIPLEERGYREPVTAQPLEIFPTEQNTEQNTEQKMSPFQPTLQIPQKDPEKALHIEFSSSYLLDSQSFLSKDMIRQNTASLMDVLNLSLNQLKVEGEDPASFGVRLLLLSSAGYLHAVAAAQSHEMGHLIAAQHLGLHPIYDIEAAMRKGFLAGVWRTDERDTFRRDFFTSQENCLPFPSEEGNDTPDNYNCRRHTDLPLRITANTSWVSPREAMGHIIAGTTMSTEIAGTFLKDRFAGKPPALNALSYSIFHLGYAAYVFGWHLPHGNFGKTITTNNSTDDFWHYTLQTFINDYLPYPANDRRWESINVTSEELSRTFDPDFRDFPTYRPRGRQEKVIYAKHQASEAGDKIFRGDEKIADYNLIATAAASLADPYLHASVASVLRFLFTGEDSIHLPEVYIPRISGRIGIPRPQYGLEWNIPLGEESTLQTGTYFALDKEIALSFFFEFGSLPLFRIMESLPITATLGGEFIAQEEGSRYFSNLTLGGAGRVQLNIPILENAGITAGVRYKSPEVWSPAFEGLPEQMALTLGMYGEL